MSEYRDFVVRAIREGKAITSSVISFEYAYDLATELDLSCVYDQTTGKFHFDRSGANFTREHQIQQNIRVVRS